MKRLFFFLLVTTQLFSQNIEFKGKLLDANTKEPIAYANISFLSSDKGISSQENGEFKLVIDKKLLNSKVHISCLNYKDTILVAKDLQNKIAYLDSKSVELKEVVISKKKSKKIILDEVKKTVTPFHSSDIRMIGKLFPNSLNDDFFVDRIKIYFSKRNSQNATFRIRIFSVDDITKKPKNDLLLESIPVKIKQGQIFVEIDLQDKYIQFPEKGLFVVFEKLLIPENLYNWENNENGRNNYYAPIIGLTKNKKYKNTNRIVFYAYGKWHFLPTPDNNFLHVPAIELELSN